MVTARPSCLTDRIRDRSSANWRISTKDEKVVSRSSLYGCEATADDGDYADVYQCQPELCGASVILAEESVFAQPSKGALENPHFRADEEPLAPNRAQHSLQEP